VTRVNTSIHLNVAEAVSRVLRPCALDLLGIDRDAGCVVVVRPDQHVAHVLGSTMPDSTPGQLPQLAQRAFVLLLYFAARSTGTAVWSRAGFIEDSSSPAPEFPSHPLLGEAAGAGSVLRAGWARCGPPEAGDRPPHQASGDQ